MGLTVLGTHAMEQDTTLQENNSVLKSSMEYTFLYTKRTNMPGGYYSSQDGSILLYKGTCLHLITKQEVPLEDFPSYPFALPTFSLDGSILFTSVEEKGFLYDTTTGKRRALLEGHTDCIDSVTFSPDGTTVLTGSADRTARLWNAVTGELVKEFTRHTKGITSVAYSPDGNTILTASRGKLICLWNITEGTTIEKGSFVTPDNVASAQFSWDGKTILLELPDFFTYLYNPTGKLLLKFERGTIVALSPDRKAILSRKSGTKVVNLWNASTGKFVECFECPACVSSIGWTPDNQTIIIGLEDGTARLVDITTEKELHVLQHDPPNSCVSYIGCSTDGNFIFTRTPDSMSTPERVHVWIRLLPTAHTTSVSKEGTTLSFTQPINLDDDSQKECSIQ